MASVASASPSQTLLADSRSTEPGSGISTELSSPPGETPDTSALATFLGKCLVSFGNRWACTPDNEADRHDLVEKFKTTIVRRINLAGSTDRNYEPSSPIKDAQMPQAEPESCPGSSAPKPRSVTENVTKIRPTPAMRSVPYIPVASPFPNPNPLHPLVREGARMNVLERDPQTPIKRANACYLNAAGRIVLARPSPPTPVSEPRQQRQPSVSISTPTPEQPSNSTDLARPKSKTKGKGKGNAKGIAKATSDAKASLLHATVKAKSLTIRIRGSKSRETKAPSPESRQGSPGAATATAPTQLAVGRADAPSASNSERSHTMVTRKRTRTAQLEAADEPADAQRSTDAAASEKPAKRRRRNASVDERSQPPRFRRSIKNGKTPATD